MQSWVERSSGDLGVPRNFRYAGLAHTTRQISPIRTAIRLLSAQSPDAKRDIDVLFQKIDGPILQAELNVDLRKRREELRHNRLEMQTAQGDGGRHTQLPARCRVLAGGGALGFGHIGEDSFDGGDVASAPRPSARARDSSD